MAAVQALRRRVLGETALTRTADEARRRALLERIVDYATENGIAEMSLRPLAKAVGSSPRVLLYYFGSKDQLIVEIIARARARQREQIANLKLVPGLGPREICRMCWRVMSDLRFEGLFRLWFEVYGLALQDRSRFPGFLERAVEDWLDFLSKPSVEAGFTREHARVWATVVIDGFRGFLMDLCATRDRERVDAAVELWLDLITPADREHLPEDDRHATA